ncbi:hypothetical protein GXW71_08665 [Roseomonas hellenica]|uniref:Hedgehog/Intein (Hint) domain-containing protein n=1 Tax=Plastoroseomonas hellenica TaxID=2687306 RepID=A0ABS5EWZ1_9PROT|nr:hypothetical protein [Plastoroseomonas hellenica]MBR0664425.1 hypothetical protein [Plastoroseomonas hellenica]
MAATVTAALPKAQQSAPTNADARAIEGAIRLERRAMGELGEDALTLLACDQMGAQYPMTLAIGDRVRLFDRVNARFLDGGRGNIGNNGSVLEVRTVSAEGVSLRTAHGRDGFASWETLADKPSGRIRLALGDVLTIDSAQGITSDEPINALPAGSTGAKDSKPISRKAGIVSKRGCYVRRRRRGRELQRIWRHRLRAAAASLPCQSNTKTCLGTAPCCPSGRSLRKVIESGGGVAPGMKRARRSASTGRWTPLN